MYLETELDAKYAGEKIDEILKPYVEARHTLYNDAYWSPTRPIPDHLIQQGLGAPGFCVANGKYVRKRRWNNLESAQEFSDRVNALINADSRIAKMYSESVVCQDEDYYLPPYLT